MKFPPHSLLLKLRMAADLNRMDVVVTFDTELQEMESHNDSQHSCTGDQSIFSSSIKLVISPSSPRSSWGAAAKWHWRNYQRTGWGNHEDETETGDFLHQALWILLICHWDVPWWCWSHSRNDYSHSACCLGGGSQGLNIQWQGSHLTSWSNYQNFCTI